MICQISLIEKNNMKDIDKDPAIILSRSINNLQKQIISLVIPYQSSINKGERLFIADGEQIAHREYEHDHNCGQY